MKILITGAAGFLAKRLINKLIIEKICSSLILCDFNYEGLEKLIENFSSFESKITIYNINLKNQNSVEKIFEKNTPDIVFHLAAYTNIINIDQKFQFIIENNFQVNETIKNVSLKFNVKKFFYISNNVKDDNYYLYDALSRISELYFFKNFNCVDSKVKFISFRIGNIVNSKFLGLNNNSDYFNNEILLKYPKLLIEIDEIDEIIDHLIDLYLYFDKKGICIYNSKNTNTINFHFSERLLELTKNNKSKDKIYESCLILLDCAVNKTFHNKITICTINCINKININKIFDKILFSSFTLNLDYQIFINNLFREINYEISGNHFLKKI
jgi:hypothetical protein